MFIKYEAEVSSRVNGGQRGVVDFGKLLLRPMSRNSVLEEFRVRRFAVIQEEIRSRSCNDPVYPVSSCSKQISE